MIAVTGVCKTHSRPPEKKRHRRKRKKRKKRRRPSPGLIFGAASFLIAWECGVTAN